MTPKARICLPIVGWAMACASIGLAACSDDNQTLSAAKQERLERIEAMQYGPLPNTIDITTGTGPASSTHNRMRFAASVRDDAGVVVAQGILMEELHHQAFHGSYVVTSSNGFDQFIFGSVYGMRVGGEREFDLRVPRQSYEQLCTPSSNHQCLLPIGTRAVIVPNQTYRMRVKLESLCTPHYAFHKGWSIPPGAGGSLEEKGC